ncbi:MAG: hypothetical protein FWD81_02065 [Methanomassiliicoccaceae archaeon]|nr:hypothetical protein [Methanomassiliicoccaceae archaeon]
MARKKVRVEMKVAPGVTDDVKEQLDRTVDYCQQRAMFIVNEDLRPEDEGSIDGLTQYQCFITANLYIPPVK